MELSATSLTAGDPDRRIDLELSGGMMDPGSSGALLGARLGEDLGIAARLIRNQAAKSNDAHTGDACVAPAMIRWVARCTADPAGPISSVRPSSVISICTSTPQCGQGNVIGSSPFLPEVLPLRSRLGLHLGGGRRPLRLLPPCGADHPDHLGERPAPPWLVSTPGPCSRSNSASTRRQESSARTRGSARPPRRAAAG